MTIGETLHPRLTEATPKKTKRTIRGRLGLGGISQVTIDRLHTLVNMLRAGKGKDPIDFSLPANRPRSRRRRTRAAVEAMRAAS